MPQQAAFQLRIAGPGVTTGVRDLPPGETTIGRASDNTLILDHDKVSRHHARIECAVTGSCVIVDQASTNGTLVNGVRLVLNEQTPLVAGAVVTIGPFTLTLERISSPAVVQPKPPPAARLPKPKRPPAPPPPPAPPNVPPPGESSDRGVEPLLPGLTLHSQRLLQYLPEIYQPPCGDDDDSDPCFSDTDFSPKRFVSRFLGLFESILLPIEWTVGNFDLYLDPSTAPLGFLNWLANWFEITWDESWTLQQQRTLLREAHEIYARRGTRRALSRMLEIYLGQPPIIVDDAKNQKPYTFDVIVPVPDDPVRRASIQAIIDAHKPAHTMYRLKFQT